jgi:hypothetical protein
MKRDARRDVRNVKKIRTDPCESKRTSDVFDLLRENRRLEESVLEYVREKSLRNFCHDVRPSVRTDERRIDKEILSLFEGRGKRHTSELSTGDYSIHVVEGSLEAVNTLGVIVKEFEYEGTLADGEGRHVSITRERKGTKLSTFRERCDPRTWNGWMARFFRRMCEISDIMWNQGIYCPCFGVEDVTVLENGNVHLRRLNETEKIDRKHRRSIVDICQTLHFMVFGVPYGSRSPLPTRVTFRTEKVEAFIRRGTCALAEYRWKNPLCDLSLISEFQVALTRDTTCNGPTIPSADRVKLQITREEMIEDSVSFPLSHHLPA